VVKSETTLAWWAHATTIHHQPQRVTPLKLMVLLGPAVEVMFWWWLESGVLCNCVKSEADGMGGDGKNLQLQWSLFQ